MSTARELSVSDVFLFVLLVIVLVFLFAYVVKILDIFGVIASALGHSIWSFIDVVFTSSTMITYALLLGAAFLLIALVYAYITGEE